MRFTAEPGSVELTKSVTRGLDLGDIDPARIVSVEDMRTLGERKICPHCGHTSYEMTGEVRVVVRP